MDGLSGGGGGCADRHLISARLNVMLFRSNQALIYESKHLSVLKAVCIHAEVKQAVCAHLRLPPGHDNIVVVVLLFISLTQVWKPTQIETSVSVSLIRNSLAFTSFTLKCV